MAHRPDLEPHQLPPGDWCWYQEGFYAMLPNGLLANLSGHTFTGTPESPTVRPSILTTSRHSGLEWHGYLTDGQFKEC